MNFISLAVSILISNYILIRILYLLPFKKKRLIQIIAVSLIDVGTIINYIIAIFSSTNLVNTLIILGEILSVFVAYIAIMMILLDGVILFKSRRLRQFERDLNNKSGKSIPRYALSSICLILFVVLLFYTITTIANYDADLLVSLIGAAIGTALFLGFGIYFLISGLPQHKSIKAEKLLFVLNLNGKTRLFTTEISTKDSYQNAIGSLSDMYILDEYGLLITPTDKYVVKGMKITNINDDIISKIHMDEIEANMYSNAIGEFNKYTRKKITIDENQNIIKNQPIK